MLETLREATHSGSVVSYLLVVKIICLKNTKIGQADRHLYIPLQLQYYYIGQYSTKLKVWFECSSVMQDFLSSFNDEVQ